LPGSHISTFAAGIVNTGSQPLGRALGFNAHYLVATVVGINMAKAPSTALPLATERIDPRFSDLDLWPTGDVLAAMWEGQLAAVAAVQYALPALTRAIDAAASRLGSSGRLVYIGAGTSGRLGAQDGTELTPTFHWPADRVIFILAGGISSLTRSAEGAEDDSADAISRVDAACIGAADVVISLAASGTTPFTLAALKQSRKRGALTIGIANNAGAPLLKAAAHAILVETGPEVIAGSTRMKAGTAQKVVLNLFSSALMVRLGRVHGGIMVDMQATNDKLARRAVAIVSHISNCSAAAAARALASADGTIKPAILLASGVVTKANAAQRRLAKAKGNLRRAMAKTSARQPPR
jgi:N-acetylmuramic acid 6-phosphate etherase